LNNRQLKTLIRIFETSELTRLRVEREDATVELRKEASKPAPVKRNASEDVSVQCAGETEGRHVEAEPQPQKPSRETTPVKAPLVGTFYEAPAPDQPPFVQEGQTIKQGETLCIVEAMKVMNEIPAPCDGTVSTIHASNGELVEFDQLLMEIE